MIIKSIEIENFLSYYGKNLMTFDEGPTIIIGQNNTGKSKLFDAFNWVLFNRAYKTETEAWLDTKEWKEDIVNKKARLECKIDSVVNTSVALEFFDEKNNKYLLVREYEVKKNNGSSWSCLRNSNLYLTITDSLTYNNEDYTDEGAEEKVKELFPKNLSKYFLFQGESISQIMSLSNKSDFRIALHDLSRIEIFEKAQTYTNKVYKQIKKEFEEKEDADKFVQEKKITLSNEIERLKQTIETIDKESETYFREKDVLKAVFEKKDTELKKYEECASILKDIEVLENQLRIRNEHRISEINNQRRLIFDTWMYAGTENIFQRFLDFYRKNKIEKRIPEPIRQEFVKEMLSEEICKICGSQAPKGSPQYNTINSFINDKSLDKEIEVINALSYLADSTLRKIFDISDDIKEYYKNIAKINSDIEKIRNQLKVKEEDLRSVIPKDISADELKLKDFAKLQADRDKTKNEIERINNKILTCNVKKEAKDKEVEEKIKEYEALIAKSSNEKERAKVILAGKVNEITSQFYQKFFNRLICDIQKSANDYFSKMTQSNRALSGSVKVDSDLNEVYTIDENGNRMYNINQANKISLQISFVAAVLSVSNNFWETYFPFIADAPISALGGNNKITAVDTMIDIFNQSIIILKDDAVTEDADSIKNDLTRSLIFSENNIKNAYELVMHGDSLEEQHTTIKKIK